MEKQYYVYISAGISVIEYENPDRKNLFKLGDDPIVNIKRELMAQ
jgi:hypothetical protein